MKQTKWLFSLVLIFLSSTLLCVGSCSKSEPIESPEETRARLTLNATSQNGSELLASLRVLNTKLLAERTPTEYRSFWKKVGRVCAVVAADAIGGYEVGKVGAKVGAYFGPKGAAVGAGVGAAIGAAGASYSAYQNLPSTTGSQGASSVAFVGPIATADYTSVAKVYGQCIALQSSSGTSACTGPGMRSISSTPSVALYNEGININLPQAYKDEALKVGQIHNMALGMLINSSGSEVTLPDTGESPQSTNRKEVEFVTSSPDMVHAYDRCISLVKQGLDPDHLTKDLKTSGNRSDIVISLFMEVLQEYPNGIEDVNTLINLYILRIERSSELSTEEKQNIYNALSIAAHSYNYWTTSNVANQVAGPVAKPVAR